ncbi:hypothetical protein PYCC9005_001320 [Savitreella phatthalungensis]
MSTTIEFNGSTFTGSLTPGGVRCFYGIPYAQPPVGERRWRKPARLSKSHVYGTLDCRRPGAVCPQPSPLIDGRPTSFVPRGQSQSEDCLNVNIRIPSGKPPTSAGWPVFVWIHGGWLQIGVPLQEAGYDFDPLFSQEEDGLGLRAIIVAVGYRLNVFGFLAGEAVGGNYGLWDQRCGIEWVRDNIAHFGGDPSNMTVGGLSAGANSTHLQIYHELFHRDAIAQGPTFTKAIMYSNAVSAQSKPRHEAQMQFDELRKALGVEDTLSHEAAVDLMRQVPAEKLVGVIPRLKVRAFRHVSHDDDFLPSTLVQDFVSGEFARRFHERGFRLINGEVAHEEATYRGYNPPTLVGNRREFALALEEYYSEEVSGSLLRHFGHSTAAHLNDHLDHYGDIVAAAQVRAPTRHLARSLDCGQDLPVLRYKISWRPKSVIAAAARSLPPAHLRSRKLPYPGTGADGPLVPHGSDLAVWFYQARAWEPSERLAIKAWLAPWKMFIEEKGRRQNDVGQGWGTTEINQIRHLKANGSIAVETDGLWDPMLKVADAMMPPRTRPSAAGKARAKL